LLLVVQHFGKGRLLHVGTTEIHWVEIGSGRPLVLLHGLSDTHRTWRRIAPALARAGFRVIMPDLPGHGLSGRPDADYSVEWHTDAICAWVRALRLRRFDLVGHSFGGGVALQLLMRQGWRVRRLGLIAAGGLGREVTVAIKLLGLPGIDPLVDAGLSLGTRVGLQFAARGAYSPHDRNWHAWAHGAPGTARALLRTARGAVDRDGQRDNIYRYLDRIRELPPLALFWGDRDPVLPYSHAVRAAALIPGSRLVRFRGCGHFPHLERSAELSADLVEFLRARAPLSAIALWSRRIWGALARTLKARFSPAPPRGLLGPRRAPSQG
jgi:pimeloyl-ACP methyl ester carboxylesterase